MNNFVRQIRHGAETRGDLNVFTFLEDGEDQALSLTLAQADRRARAVAAYLQSGNFQGQRALLVYPPGLDFIEGMLACLYAGVIPIPAFPPDPARVERTLPRLQAILKDSGATLLLTTKPIKSASAFITHQAPEIAGMPWIATDKIGEDLAGRWREPPLREEDLAILQYTSGSTGEPKGVMISHGNLTHNLEVIRRAFLLDTSDRGVFWLPPYHDMGLVGGILGPLYHQTPVTLFSPLHFLQKPLRWLRAISRSGASISGGPNFAYEMCLKKITPEQKKELDLSHWSIAFTGAEPIQAETLRRFQDGFAVCGFSGTAFLPCYGLAEGTLMVSGRSRGSGFRSLPVPREKLNGSKEKTNAGGRFVEFIGCGKTPESVTVSIVHPEKLQPCAGGEIGEIWVAGPSVAQGYWRKESEMQDRFGLKLPGNGSPAFFRTGDLGFLDHGELFVTGRLKDLIIIRGQNHYPQDIEKTVRHCHPSFRPGGTAAFSLLVQREEKLVLMQEVDEDKLPREKTALNQLYKKVGRAVAESHDIEVHQLILLEKGRLPKTSSGKVQRFACREGWLGGGLPALFLLAKEREMGRDKPGIKGGFKLKGNHDSHSIQSWLVKRLAELLDVSTSQIDSTQPFTDYGLDSKDAVNLSGELEDQLGKPLSPTLLYKYPTLESLANYLAHGEPEPDEG